MTTREWKAIRRMVKDKDPLIVRTKDGRVRLTHLKFNHTETYQLILPYGTTTLYEHSELSSRTRAYLKELYDVWYTWTL